ncbi:MAG TPA: phosphomannose isomerase type II C-terminal cupin domain [Candidatus Paceibacterota bacterium]|nr:phosphomannose isomerase type II C-terminal cupin domain [Candidatus Paceibacterota bacterium]
MTMLKNRDHEDRPWGSFDRLTHGEETTVKFLDLLPEKRFSDQRHAHRSEYWVVLKGAGTATVDGIEREVGVGDEVEIPTGAWHRLKGGPEGLRVLEIAFGAFDEKDIERRDDDFGRE